MAQRHDQAKRAIDEAAELLDGALDPELPEKYRGPMQQRLRARIEEARAFLAVPTRTPRGRPAPAAEAPAPAQEAEEGEGGRLVRGTKTTRIEGA